MLPKDVSPMDVSKADATALPLDRLAAVRARWVEVRRTA